MQHLPIIGIGLEIVALAMGIIAWVVDPHTIPYDGRFYLFVIAFVLLIAGLVLIAKPQWFKKAEKPTFCYFGLYTINGKPVVIDDNFQLSMNAVGIVEKVNYWISPWGILPNGQANDPYYSLDVRKSLIEIVHAGGRAWDRTLPAGDYRIDFSSKNGNWYEHLTIYMSNGEIKNRIQVTTELNDGDVLYESEQQ